MKQNQSPAKIHYGWVIAVSCFFLSGGGVGIIINTLGTFIKPVSEAMGYTRAQFSLVSSLITFAGMFAYPLWGRYFSRHSIRKCMIVTGTLISILMVSFSFCQRLWQFYALSLLIGCMTGSISSLPITTLINNWFDDCRGIATGLASCGSGLAMIIIPVVSLIITSDGWRAAYRFVGILFFLFIVTISVFILRDRPEEKSLKPYKSDKIITKPSVSADHGITFAEAKKTVSFKAMLLVAFFGGVMNNSIVSHIYAFTSDLGYSAVLASVMASVQMLALMLSKLTIGFVFDRLGLKTGLLLSVFGYLISAVCNAVASLSPVFIVISVICAGIGGALPAMSIAYSMRQLFGNREYSAICGMSLSFTFFGNTVGTSVTGLVYDIFGSYQVAWISLIVIAIITAATFSFAVRMRNKELLAEGITK